MTQVALAFTPQVLQVPLANILPSRMLPASVPGSVKYVQIRCSIQDVGVIEPLSSPSPTQRQANIYCWTGMCD